MAETSRVMAWMSEFLPAYPANRVSEIASSLDEKVLWSGPAFLPGTVSGHLTVALACWVASFACLLVGIVLGVGWLTGRLKSGYGLVAVAIVSFACVSALMSEEAISKAGAKMARGYVVTERRVIRIDGEDGRMDSPASAITSIRRSGNRTTMTFLERGHAEFEVPEERGATLDKALRRLADANFRASPLVGGEVGRP